MQEEPPPKELHSERVRAGQARARAEGRIGGRKTVYTDAVILEAMRRHDTGETWAGVAVSIGISLDRLYARVRQLKRSAALHA